MGLFTKKSNRTNSEQKDDALRPITLRMPASASMKTILPVLEKYEFDILTPREEFHEIYCKKGGYEFTLSFIEDFGKTHLTILIYNERHAFKLKKNLRDLMVFLRNNLENCIE